MGEGEGRMKEASETCSIRPEVATSISVTVHPLSPPGAAVVSQIHSVFALAGRRRAPPVTADSDAHRPAPVVAVTTRHAGGVAGGSLVAVHMRVNFRVGVVEDAETIARRVVPAAQAHLLQRGGKVLSGDCLPHTTSQTSPVRHLVRAGRGTQRRLRIK